MRRFVPLIVALSLLGSACSGDPEADRPAPTDEPSATAEASAPPTPAEALGLVEGWGPTTAELERAATIVGRMRLPDPAGQVIVAEWRGTAPPVAMVRRLHLGGVIAFADNVSSTQQIRGVHATLERAVRRKWPLFLAVDREGGIVERVKGDATRFPTFMSAGAAGDVRLTRNAARASGAELRGLGFDVVFAPDADVTSGPGDPTIGSRSAGSDVETVIARGGAAVEGYTAAAVVPVLKHFPGHGSVPQDSHLTLPVQLRTRKQLTAVDLAPFAAAVEQGVPAIMAGHIDVRAIDPRGAGVHVEGPCHGRAPHPAGLQRPRRHRLALDGRGAGDVRRGPLGRAGPARRQRRPADAARPRRRAVRDRCRGEGRSAQAEPPGAGRGAPDRAAPAPGRGQAGRSRAGVRPGGVACPERRGADRGGGQLPWPASSGSTVTPAGDPVAVANFSGAARAAGLTVLTRQAPPASLVKAEPPPKRKKKESRKAFSRRTKAWRTRERKRSAALNSFPAAEDARLARGTNIGFSGYRDAAHDGEIAVATNTPYVLGSVSAPVRIAAYGDTPGAMSAPVDVLLGKAKAPGSLPVKVAGVEKTGC
ncbi:hypothetical protein LP418_16335 [Nocardioides sp. B-3]|nr:glycoside hydrolase family 3 N-terminal domain-containing protein [Nocardioides sp. B-3]UUZ57915.1 hypothetical protein LP418_16335 [Nocardioides sp. B-3]